MYDWQSVKDNQYARNNMQELMSKGLPQGVGSIPIPNKPTRYHRTRTRSSHLHWQHLLQKDGSKDSQDEIGETIDTGGEGECLSSQLGGWDLGDDVTQWAQGEGEGELDENEHDSLHPRVSWRGLVVLAKAEKSHDPQRDDAVSETGKPEESSTDFGQDEGTDHGVEHTQTSETEGHVEGVLGAETNLVEKVGGETNWITGEVLGDEEHGADLQTVTVGALEAIEISAAQLEVALVGVRLDHHGESVDVVSVLFLVAEMIERLLCVIQAVLADQPPWGFGEPVAE